MFGMNFATPPPSLNKKLLTRPYGTLPIILPDDVDICEFEQLVSAELWTTDIKLACYTALKRSHLFDEEDYLNRYADVRQSNLDPIKHYVYYGVAEDRIWHCTNVHNLRNKLLNNNKNNFEYDITEDHRYLLLKESLNDLQKKYEKLYYKYTTLKAYLHKLLKLTTI